MINKRLAILQMMDTTFPIGLFNQSYGFESYINQGIINNDQSFYNWLHMYIQNQLKYNDLLIVQESYNKLISSKTFQMTCLIRYNQLIHAQNLSSEVRSGNSRTGKQFLNLAIQLFDHPLLKQFSESICKQKSAPHPSVVYAIIGYILKIDLPELLDTFLYSVISSLIQNAVRGIPIGQAKAQLMLIKMHDEMSELVRDVMSLNIDDFGKGLPGNEIAQMRHETLFARMFMS
ncbi:urease accessory protein UreF [Sporolactobacillus terrae]|uniref:urease accessory protein UreF n=1 Tax=Sporolactobacillus terrae TaxID=269673 RepID=UPI001118D5DE|nr:urease accessory protein UreF [Sporolactobacillus terrae]